MSVWKDVRLDEIAEILNFKRIPLNSRERERRKGNYPYYGASGIVDYVDDFLFEGEHVLISEDGENLRSRNTPIAFKATGKFWVNNHAHIVRGKEPFLNNWITYFFQNLDINPYLTGAVQPKLNKENLLSIPIRIPDFSTAKKITEILSSLDDKIELNNQINQNLEALAQALFKQWFVDFEFPNENGQPYKSSGGEMVDSELGEIPKGWGIGCLEEVIDFSNGYSFKSNDLLSEDSGDCYHVFKMGHIKKGGGLNPEGTKSFFLKENTSKLKKYVLKVGDLLMCMTDMKGNVALLGHTALMNEDEKYIVNQRVGLLRANKNEGIDYPYLYILTNSTSFIEELRSRANSGVQVNLSTSEIKSTKIVIPEYRINVLFDEVVKPFFLKLFASQKENENLINLRDTLLPKLISGELEVNESLLEQTF